jgi:hypothetical protein
MFDATGAVATALTAPPSQPFVGELASSQSAEGVYVFEFANDRPQPVTIEVSPSVGEPIAVFGGNIG